MVARLITLMFILILTVACGVRVEVVAPVAPTPTPRVFPNVDYSLGGVWRLQATPRVVFPDAQVQLFILSEQLPVLILQKRQLYIAADYDVTWFAAPQSNTQIRIRVFTRVGDNDAWEAYDTAERDLTTDTAPATTKDSLYVMMVFDEPTALQVRAEVSVIAYDADGAIITNVDATEFPVLVLRDSEGVEVNTDAMFPQFGEWNENQMIFDWRDWRGGPCGLTDWDVEVLYTACEAFESGDYQAAYMAMLSAVEETDEAQLRGALYGQLGLIQIVEGEIDTAAATFNLAVETYSETLSPFEVSVHLHNMAAAHMMREDESSAYFALQMLQELRGQLYDEAGNMLTQSIAAFYTGEYWRLDEPENWFTERGLPQADILALWKAQSE